MKYLTSRGKIWYPRNGSTAATAKDRAEILSYVATNGPMNRYGACNIFSIAMCCFQGTHVTTGHLKALRKAGKIERIGNSYQVVR